MLRFQLTSAGHCHDFSSLRGAVETAARSKDRALVVDLDAVALLGAAIIRELILCLRRLRECGGTLRVAATRPALVSSLKATGLDRVFGAI
jgi:anti-anti-sigma regulatory factor